MKKGTLSALIEDYDMMHFVSSSDISGRPLILDGSCYIFEVLSPEGLHIFYFCNPEVGLSSFDNQIAHLLKTIKSWKKMW